MKSKWEDTSVEALNLPRIEWTNALTDMFENLGELVEALREEGERVAMPPSKGGWRGIGPKGLRAIRQGLRDLGFEIVMGPVAASIIPPEPELEPPGERLAGIADEEGELLLRAVSIEEQLLNLVVWALDQRSATVTIESNLFADSETFVTPMARLMLGVIMEEIKMTARAEAATVLQELLADDKVVERLLRRMLEVLRTTSPTLLSEFQRHFGGS